jgi:hypothetical protein
MDVTPTNKMFEAMAKFTDAMCGEEPHKLLIGPGASRVRESRRAMMNFLHQLVAMCMREGGRRAVKEYGIPTQAGGSNAIRH